jgi:hypothetical protein
VAVLDLPLVELLAAECRAHEGLPGDRAEWAWRRARLDAGAGAGAGVGAKPDIDPNSSSRSAAHAHATLLRAQARLLPRPLTPLPGAATPSPAAAGRAGAQEAQARAALSTSLLQWNVEQAPLRGVAAAASAAAELVAEQATALARQKQRWARTARSYQLTAIAAGPARDQDAPQQGEQAPVRPSSRGVCACGGEGRLEQLRAQARSALLACESRAEEAERRAREAARQLRAEVSAGSWRESRVSALTQHIAQLQRRYVAALGAAGGQRALEAWPLPAMPLTRQGGDREPQAQPQATVEEPALPAIAGARGPRPTASRGIESTRTPRDRTGPVTKQPGSGAVSRLGNFLASQELKLFSGNDKKRR